MSVSNTEKIINLLVEKTSHSREDILQMIQDTIDDQGGLINEEGAASIIAYNLGIDLIETQDTTLTINQLSPDGSNITLIGRVKRIYQTNTFTRKDNTQGKVKNISLIDSTGEVRVALWESKADEFESKSIKIGDVIRISGASSKSGYQDRIELSLGGQSTIDKMDDAQSNIPEIEKAPMKTIEQINSVTDKEDISVKGKVNFKRESPNEFNRNDGSVGKVSSIRIQDQTDQIRVTFWDKDTELLNDIQQNDVVLLSNVNVGSSDYGKELTFRAYSTIKKIEDAALKQLEAVHTTSNSTDITSFKEIEDNSRGINLTGKIIVIGQKNSFEKNGETNYVGNITLADKENYQKRATLWQKQADLVDNLSVGDIVSITNASAKYNDYSQEVELSLNDYSTLQVITDQVNPEEYKVKMPFLMFNDITEPRNNVAIKLRIKKIWDPRTITRNDGTESTVLNIPVLDGNGVEGRIAAWNDDIDKIQDLIESEDYDFVNVRLKPEGDYPAEVTINAMTEISSTTLEIDTTFQSASDLQHSSYSKSDILNATVGSNIEVQGNIVDVYAPSYYEACNACGRSINNPNTDCSEHGAMTTLKMIITAMIDDSTDVVELKIFDDLATDLLSMSAKEAKELGEKLVDDKAPVDKIKHRDYIVQGRLVETTYQDIPKKELHARKILPVDPEQEVDDFLNKLDN